MQAKQVWKVPIEDKKTPGVPLWIHDIAFSPDGEQLVVAAGSCVIEVGILNGEILNIRVGHKDSVHSLSYSRDGSNLASGSADKTVIIWNSQLDGVLKYSHGDSVQCVAYNPVADVVLSCSLSDVGLWSPDHKNVSKHKVQSRVCSCSWTNDGQYFALGLYNGMITIWSKGGEEKIKIERPEGQPVWSLAWNPSREDHYDVLSVCDWGRKLSYYQLSGRQIGKDRQLGFDPCFFTHYSSGEYAFIGGSNKKVCVYSREGVMLTCIGEERDCWVWMCRSSPTSSYIVVGFQDGTLVCYTAEFGTVHGLFRDRYAYREGLTDVVVQNLVTEEKVKLRCRDLVKKIAIFKNKLAVQLTERIVLYELSSDDYAHDMQYLVKEKINKKLECSLLVACSQNVVLCMDKKLQCLSMTGETEREWGLEAQIRYIKVVGGPPRKEAILTGLKNGQVLKLFIDNPFPVQLVKISSAVRCVDLSASGCKLAVVDENNVLLVYDVTKKVLLYQEPNAGSVAWNSQFEDMLCFSGGGVMSIKASTFPSHQRKLQTGQGFVVGFSGSKIFSLYHFLMTTTDVPQSAPLVQYLERKMFKEAYKVACLGVTDSDWKTLAMEALEGMDFEIAKKAFIRIKDLRFLELIHSIEERQKQGEVDSRIFLADIYAYQSKFDEAARLYKQAGHPQMAVEMYTDLRQFEQAKMYMQEMSGGEEQAQKLISLQAEWANTTNNAEAACDMYLAAKEYGKAVEIMGDNSWTQRIIELSNDLDKSMKEPLRQCAYQLKKLGEYNYASDIYEKMEDYEALAALYVETQQWERGFELVETKPDLKDNIYLPYATCLMESDRFEEAQEALTKAGRRNEAVNLLEQLAMNAVTESRYEDAGYFYWLLARACLEESRRVFQGGDDATEDQYQQISHEYLNRFHENLELSEIYYAYHPVHRFTNQPFTSLLPEALFNMARFLTHKMMKQTPIGVSRVTTLLTLAKQSKQVGAFKVARYAYEKLQSLKIPTQLQEIIDTGSLTIRSKPFQDKEELQPLCYRCSTTNPLLNPSGNFCINCKQPFVFSFVSFEILPLVEFVLEDGISDEEAIKLIRREPHRKNRDKWMETRSGDVEVLHFHDDDISKADDPFAAKLMSMNGEDNVFVPVIVDRETLASLHRQEVVIRKWEPPLKNQYYRSLLPDVRISLCNTCNQMFYSDDYELEVLCKGYCPFCRLPPDHSD